MTKKRFTDTDIWKKAWFRKLPPSLKCFWMYLCDNCDHAGIWEVDFEVAEMYIGGKLDGAAIRAAFSEHYMELAGGTKWFIKDFLLFQYGAFMQNNRVHNSAMSILLKEGLCKELSSSWPAPTMPLARGILGAKDKDKDKDEDKVKDKYMEYVYLTKAEHGELVKLFGAAGALHRIESLNNYIGSRGKKYRSHYHTILSWEKNGNNSGKSLTKGDNTAGAVDVSKYYEAGIPD
jgi:hypothetical protein